MFVNFKEGQIAIPEKIAEKLNLRENDILECTEKDGSIILTLVTGEARNKYSNLKILCFGKLAVFADKNSILLTNKKAMELIAYLVCQTGACANKTTAAEALWPEALPENAANNLYKATQSIKNLQKQQIFIPIESLRGDFKLLTEYIYCDLWEFERLYNNRSIDNWEKAEKIYSNILLFENGYSWAAEYEGHYDIMYYEILEYLYRYYEKSNIKKNSIIIVRNWKISEFFQTSFRQYVVILYLK